MPSPDVITPALLARRVGAPHSPIMMDVRTPEDFAAHPRALPSARRPSHGEVGDWAESFRGGPAVVVICHKGLKLTQGVAAWLRHHGATAETLEGRFLGPAEAGLPLVSLTHVPPRDGQGRTLWVTRARPKVDRIACPPPPPWLIRHFVDPTAVFLFVAPSEVAAVAERFGATQFDIDCVFWSHRGPLCTFDVMIEEFTLRMPALHHLACLVCGADRADVSLAPEAAGLLGLSRMYRDDLAQLEPGITLYDAIFRWRRDAAQESHNWPTGRAA